MERYRCGAFPPSQEILWDNFGPLYLAGQIPTHSKEGIETMALQSFVPSLNKYLFLARHCSGCLVFSWDRQALRSYDAYICVHSRPIKIQIECVYGKN
jgi:hypothetical protein